MNPTDQRTARPTLLDRLIDMDPQLSGDPSITQSESIRRYKMSVLRDLEWLLNTRRSIIRVPRDCKEVQRSTFLFGLPDINSLSEDTDARKRLQREIEECIDIFEPRLSNLRVSFVDDQDSRRSLHFVIDGILKMEPNAERVVFDTTLDLSSGKIQVGG